jgi:hypothetical protein
LAALSSSFEGAPSFFPYPVLVHHVRDDHQLAKVLAVADHAHAADLHERLERAHCCCCCCFSRKKESFSRKQEKRGGALTT